MLTVVMTSMPASSSTSMSCQRFVVAASRGRWCARARRPGRPRVAGRGRRRRPSRRGSRPGSSTARRGTTSRPSTCPAVKDRPCVSTKPTTTSVPRSGVGGPRRAWRTVFRRRGRRRGRCAVVRGPRSRSSPCPVVGRRQPAAPARARLSSVTLTRGSTEEPERPALGVVVDQVLYLRRREPAGRSDAGDLQLAYAGEMCGVEAAGGGGEGVRRDGAGRRRGSRATRALAPRRPRRAARGRRGRGWSRRWCCRRTRSADRRPGWNHCGRSVTCWPIRLEEPTTLPSCSTREPLASLGDDLSDAEDGEGVAHAADEGEGEQHPRAPADELAGEGGHGDHVDSGDEGDDEVDELDADERRDDAAEPVDEQVAAQHRRGAETAGSARRAGPAGSAPR